MSFLFSSTNARIETMSMSPNLTVLLLSLLSLTFTACGAAVRFAKELAPTTDWRKSGVGVMTEGKPSSTSTCRQSQRRQPHRRPYRQSGVDGQVADVLRDDGDDVRQTNGWVGAGFGGGGSAQGPYGAAGLRQGTLDFIMVMSFCFTHYGHYNGSCISVLGMDPTMTRVREMPIVGGSGVFRLAAALPWRRLKCSMLPPLTPLKSTLWPSSTTISQCFFVFWGIIICVILSLLARKIFTFYEPPILAFNSNSAGSIQTKINGPKLSFKIFL